MKLDYIGTVELFKDSDEVLMAKLLAAHQAIRTIQMELKNDPEIKKLQKQIEELKGPYRKRMLRQQSLVSSAELIANSRKLVMPEDKLDDD